VTHTRLQQCEELLGCHRVRSLAWFYLLKRTRQSIKFTKRDQNATGKATLYAISKSILQYLSTKTGSAGFSDFTRSTGVWEAPISSRVNSSSFSTSSGSCQISIWHKGNWGTSNHDKGDRLTGILFVYYESIKGGLKRRPVYECRYDERLKTKTEGSTRLTYTGWLGGLEHRKIETRLTNEKFVSVMGECVIVRL